ncbi:MAG: carboxypeptidase-like regulatory domain-containing protein [Algoriphagus sp.]|uniref:carboxypeptidase regulatory-like domain-containing protein n=1 Tax=Algoriphagus sp. TaxID=1872435 RepID=UPI0027307AC0|nr:carboxypeptidase regulatory-like domain-containing protein [Algoriphagus sp.]MDP2042561.1 carboxypeptidase-like regulatory domain-containing protein [Algoriphagus sp.]MDP3472378.1 carboxypeptidase-like regulatory domain-containing protein [Algoriphagus sp.]
MRLYFIFITLLFSINASAQTTVVTGRVLDSKSGNPIPQAHVFIPKTSLQTFTDSIGNFSLSGIVPGRWMLASAKEGYLAVTEEISPRRSLRGESNPISLALESTPNSTIPFKYSGNSKKHLQRFISQFIGTDLAKNVVLANPDAIRFEVDKKTKSVFAHAQDALIFKNSATGYLITVWINHPLNLNETPDFDSMYWSYFPSQELNSEEKMKTDAKRLVIYKNSPEYLLRNLLTSSSDTLKLSFGEFEGEFDLEIRSPFELKSVSGNVVRFSFEGEKLTLKENGVPVSSQMLQITESTPNSPLTSLPQNFNGEKLLALEQIQKNARVLEEKVFLHTDRDVYRIGDVVYFKAYLNYGNPMFSEESSKVLHLELLDTAGTKIEHHLFRIEGGTASGQLTLPYHLRSQNFFLKAYTLWSSNYGPENEFVKPIQVLLPGFTPQGNGLTEYSNGVTLFTENVLPTPGDSVKLSFMVRDLEGNLVPANLSVSVVDYQEAIQLDETLTHIGEFLSKPRNRPYPELEGFTQPREFGFNLIGKTIDTNARPIRSNLEILVDGLFEKIDSQTDEKGIFELNNLNFEGDYTLGIKAIATSNAKVEKIDLEIKSSPHSVLRRNFDFPQPRYTGKTSPRLDSLAALPPLRAGEILLDEVSVATKKFDASGPAIYGKAQQVHLAKDLNLTGLTDQFVRALGAKSGFLTTGSPPILTSRGGVPLIMIDNVPISGPSGSTFSGPTLPEANMSYSTGNPQFARLSDINVFNIERIEIIRSMSSIFGAAGQYGVINIIMKTGQDIQRDILNSGNSFRDFNLTGFSKAKPFQYLDEDAISPVYHWDPTLTIPQGKTSGSTEFILPKNAESFWVIVNGITENGDPVYGKFFMRSSPLGENRNSHD